VEVLADVSPQFIEDLTKTLSQALDERRTIIKQKKKESVPVPSRIGVKK
jgi:hypothetical protein